MIKINNNVNGNLREIDFKDGPYSKFIGAVLVLGVVTLNIGISYQFLPFLSQINLALFFLTLVIVAPLIFIFNRISIKRLENAELLNLYSSRLLLFNIAMLLFSSFSLEPDSLILVSSFSFALFLIFTMYIMIILISFFNKSYMRVKTIINASGIEIEYSVSFMLASNKWVRMIKFEDTPIIIVREKDVNLTNGNAHQCEFQFDNIESFSKSHNKNRIFSLFIQDKNYKVGNLPSNSEFSLIAKTYNTYDVLQLINSPSEFIRTILYSKPKQQ